jgi:hypothetical protein
MPTTGWALRLAVTDPATAWTAALDATDQS